MICSFFLQYFEDVMMLLGKYHKGFCTFFSIFIPILLCYVQLFYNILKMLCCYWKNTIHVNIVLLWGTCKISPIFMTMDWSTNLMIWYLYVSLLLMGCACHLYPQPFLRVKRLYNGCVFFFFWTYSNNFYLHF